MIDAERQTHTRTTLNKRTDQPPRTDYQEEKPIDLDAAYTIRDQNQNQKNKCLGRTDSIQR